MIDRPTLNHIDEKYFNVKHKTKMFTRNIHLYLLLKLFGRVNIVRVEQGNTPPLSAFLPILQHLVENSVYVGQSGLSVTVKIL